MYQGAGTGEIIRVGEILVVVGYEGEAWAPEEESPPEDLPIVGTLSSDAVLLGDASELPGEVVDRPKALPLVRRLAREHDVDLATVVGTGPNGRITREDVLAVVEGAGGEATVEESVPQEELPVTEPPAIAPAEEEQPALEPADEPTVAMVVSEEGDERLRMSRLRRTIAERMSLSWREIPHVTAFDAADASRLLAARRALAGRTGSDMPIEALIIKAVVPALKAFPQFNATIDGEDLVLRHAFRIGVAVDTDEGLIVPVLHDVGEWGVSELAAGIVRLAEAARTRSLEPAELTGATFTVSNIGAVGGGLGTPIVPYGTTAILSLGRAQDEAVVRDGEVVVATMMPLSLSYDHRVIDGALGRRFLAMVKENLEEPALFLAE